MKKKLITFLVVFFMILSTAPVSAYETSDIDIIGDVFFARPGGIAAIVVGSTIFVLALPFSLPTRSVHVVGRYLVSDPVEFTFCRPVGDFHYKLGSWDCWYEEEQVVIAPVEEQAPPEPYVEPERPRIHDRN
ncbi:MAG: hypothetical protein CVU43_23955 [Chloroflexi bacterium HGW-Chloroflexi-5]|jgi:hypothetical protein|nr:MAG: hypothetical protein CVU43_23955 [Chloroflexi bacterium HGW-Chloroflexi-5]